jgi:hypothetical protein
MAKGRGRPKGDRDDVPARIDRKLGGMAKAISTARGVSIGEYISSITSATIHRDYAKMLREIEEKGGAGS